MVATTKDIDRAIAAAERFIESAHIAKNDRYNAGAYYYGGKHNASMKRTSMDLTRVLVAIRK